MTDMNLPVRTLGLQFVITEYRMLISPCPDDRPMPCPKLLGSTRLHYYWSYVSARTTRPVAWLTHEGSGLRLYLRRGHQVRSLLLPLEGDEPYRTRDYEIMYADT